MKIDWSNPISIKVEYKDGVVVNERKTYFCHTTTKKITLYTRFKDFVVSLFTHKC